MELYSLCYCQSGFFLFELLAGKCNASRPMLFGVTIVGSFLVPYSIVLHTHSQLSILLLMSIWVDSSFGYLMVI